MVRSHTVGRRLKRAGKRLRRHPKTVIGVVAFVVLWAVIVAWLYCVPAAAIEWRYWIELGNGATWPDKWLALQNDDPFWFSVAVATRTIANLAGLIGGAIAVGWFAFGGLERYMHMSQIELMRLFNAELIPSLVAELRHRGFAVKSDDGDALLKVADEIVEEFITDAERLSKSEE